MEVANCENEILPVGVINFLQEFLINQSSESLVEASLQTFGRLIRNLENLLEQT